MMKFAYDINGNRVNIDAAYIKYDYFCPVCGKKLILKKGEIRQAHFAHYSATDCKDSWHYDMSEWHLNWQNKFPKENQEVVKTLNGEKHRADILIEECKTVIEFQHSSLDSQEFEDRNAFYNKLGYKVIWVFDVTEQRDSYAIDELEGAYNKFKWRRPINTFDEFEICKNVIIYLQFSNAAADDSKIREYLRRVEESGIEDTFDCDYYEKHKFDTGCLERVCWITPNGFERFITDESIDSKEFLFKFIDYIKLNQKIDLVDTYDKLKDLYSENHTQYFQGCPMSSTHMSASSITDIPESKYDEIRPCVICEYSKYIRQKFTCGKKLADAGINEKCEILSFKKDKNGILTYIKYKQAGIEKEKKFTVEELKPVGESILDIWAREKPSVATFKNTRTGIYVRIYKNPIELVSKYRKCYGKFSQDSCSFPNESFEIYGYNKAEWRMIWYKQ